MLEITHIQYDPWHKPDVPMDEFVSRYRKLYQDVADLFEEFNVCNIRNGSCRSGGFCCHGCQYLDETGCRTNSIWCKLWMCHASGRSMEDNDLFNELRDEYKAECCKLTLGIGGRYGLTQYVLNFYGPTEYEKWKTTQTCTTSASSM